MTHTYALLEVSAAAYEEIAKKLREAGYDHAFNAEGEIDMHGIGLSRAAATEAEGPGSPIGFPGAVRGADGRFY